MLLTYAMMPLGSLARPIGSLFFGYIGNRQGRKKALCLSLTGLAIVTGLIGCLPVYDQIGFLAPALMALGRILQSFFAGGEVVGGAIFILEHTHESKHCLFSSLYGTSTMIGITLASTIIMFLGWTGQMEILWRVPFLLGFLTAMGSLFIRSKAQESPHFVANTVQTESTWQIIKSNWRIVLGIAVIFGFSSANYSLGLILPNGFLPNVAQITRSEILSINSVLLVGDMLTLPLFGWLSNKLTPRISMLTAALFSTVLAIPLFSLFEDANWTQIIIIRSILVMLGVWFSAPMHAFVQSLVPMHSRYLLISIGYAIGTKIIGSPATTLSFWLFKETGIVAVPGFYWAVAASFAVFCLYPKSPVLIKQIALKAT